jgi:hypothetical protein
MLLAPLLLACSGGDARAQSRPEVRVPILISPVNSGPYLAWAVVQERAREWHPWLRPIAVETPGFTYNITYMAKSPLLWKDHVYGSGTVAQWAASLPLKGFFPEKVAQADYKILGVMGITANFFVSLDPAVRVPADLKGKRVGVGTRTQNEWGMHPAMMLDAWGLRKDLATLDHLGDQQNIEALLDGRTQVGFLFLAFDAGQANILLAPPHRHLEASGRKFYYVNVPPEMVADANQKTGANFLVARFAANKLPQQPEPVATFGDLLPLMVHKSFPEDLAYEFVKFWVDISPKLAKLHAFGRTWSLATLSHTAKENPGAFHPGALRAYRELGALK